MFDSLMTLINVFLTTCSNSRNNRKAKRGKVVDVRRPKTFIKAGFIPEHETAIIIHGFNGTQTSQHIMYLKDGDLLHLELTSTDDYLILICIYSLFVTEI